jgi:sulfatase modifying factor 1
MGRSTVRAATCVFGGAVALTLALGGCEAILGVGSLTERGDGGSGDGGSGNGGDGSPAHESGDDSDMDSTLDAGNDGSRRADTGPGVTNDADIDTGPGITNGEAGTPPSCLVDGLGRSNCGALGTESCCTSFEVLKVDDGTYFRTYTSNGVTITGEMDPATVSGFRLDEYLVTVGRFREFVTAWDNGSGIDGGSGYEPDAGSGKHTYLNGGKGLNDTGGSYEPGWVAGDDINIAPTNTNLGSCGDHSAWTQSEGSNENLPINCVNWWESYAFCIWDGGFLPSEAEYAYAAAGGSRQREYPWGAAPPTAAYAIYGATGVEAVGTATMGVARWGQLDMAGDVWEWNLDWYNNYVDPCTDCANLTAATNSPRVLRGSNYPNGTGYLLATDRYPFQPSDRDLTVGGVGFRCARAP